MERFDIVITVNGAGELSALVRPTVNKITEKIPGARVILVLTPCQYATGRELDVAKSIEGVRHIINTVEYLQWAFLNKKPKGIDFAPKGAVVFMGGDLVHGRIIASKLKYPAIAYTEHHPFQKKAYRKFMVPDDKAAEKFMTSGLEKEKIEVVGNLMVDGVISNLHNLGREELFRRWRLDAKKQVIALLPGSRDFQAVVTIPYLMKMVELVRVELPDIQAALILSPYLTIERLNKAIEKCCRTAEVLKRRDGLLYLCIDGFDILIVDSDQHDFIKASTLAVSIPGTNTAEIAILGTPLLMFFPMDRMDVIPFEGLFELICRLPVIGFYLKSIYGRILDRRVRFFALPNIKTGREIVPEIRGIFTPNDMANSAISLLKDPGRLERMRVDLRVSMGMRGASGRVVEQILELAGE